MNEYTHHTVNQWEQPYGESQSRMGINKETGLPEFIEDIEDQYLALPPSEKVLSFFTTKK